MGTLANGVEKPVGMLLREWRERRRLSQLALALEAEISTRQARRRDQRRHAGCHEQGAQAEQAPTGACCSPTATPRGCSWIRRQWGRTGSG
ncbi:MAG: hypothetical protein ACRDJN_02920 [Chloroflexota bacterium]